MARLRKAVQRKPPAAPRPEFEVTIERLRHAANDTAVVPATIDKAGERALLTRRFSDSHVDRMLARKWITKAQHAAAVWYAERYHDAGIGSRVVANYAGVGGGGEASYGMATTNRQAQARARWREARTILSAQTLRMVENVVLHNVMPMLANQQQRARYAGHVGRALQPLAEWLGLGEEVL